MSDHRYQPAARGWIVVCREDLVLGVDPATSEERVDALWPLVRDGAASAVLLDEMTRGGISAAPGVALLEAVGGSWRVLARGDVVVEVAGDDSAVVDGRGATAWVERDVAGSPTLRVRPEGSSPSGPPPPGGSSAKGGCPSPKNGPSGTRSARCKAARTSSSSWPPR